MLTCCCCDWEQPTHDVSPADRHQLVSGSFISAIACSMQTHATRALVLFPAQARDVYALSTWSALLLLVREQPCCIVGQLWE